MKCSFNFVVVCVFSEANCLEMIDQLFTQNLLCESLSFTWMRIHLKEMKVIWIFCGAIKSLFQCLSLFQFCLVMQELHISPFLKKVHSFCSHKPNHNLLFLCEPSISEIYSYALDDVRNFERDWECNCMCLLKGNKKLCSCMFFGSSICSILLVFVNAHLGPCVHAELLKRNWPLWPSPVLILKWPATFCESWVKTMLMSGALTSLGLTESVHASMDAMTVSTKPVTDLDVALSFSSNVNAEVLLKL